MTDFSDPSFYLPVVLGIVAVVLAGWAVWRQKQDRIISRATLDLLRTMRKELQSKQTGATTGLAAQEELRKREQLEWRKLRDVAKAIGWGLDRTSEEED